LDHRLISPSFWKARACTFPFATRSKPINQKLLVLYCTYNTNKLAYDRQ
jgi:hypothetical protein